MQVLDFVFLVSFTFIMFCTGIPQVRFLVFPFLLIIDMVYELPILVKFEVRLCTWASKCLFYFWRLNSIHFVEVNIAILLWVQVVVNLYSDISVVIHDRYNFIFCKFHCLFKVFEFLKLDYIEWTITTWNALLIISCKSLFDFLKLTADRVFIRNLIDLWDTSVELVIRLSSWVSKLFTDVWSSNSMDFAKMNIREIFLEGFKLPFRLWIIWIQKLHCNNPTFCLNDGFFEIFEFN